MWMEWSCDIVLEYKMFKKIVRWGLQKKLFIKHSRLITHVLPLPFFIFLPGTQLGWLELQSQLADVRTRATLGGSKAEGQKEPGSLNGFMELLKKPGVNYSQSSFVSETN